MDWKRGGGIRRGLGEVGLVGAAETAGDIYLATFLKRLFYSWEGLEKWWELARYRGKMTL